MKGVPLPSENLTRLKHGRIPGPRFGPTPETWLREVALSAGTTAHLILVET